ncbi:hypothetical protein CCR75_006306 [Bremia lactucae]|uniref:Glycoside hydrolase 131 catalytic N-terminal domain-containing protein n=1 Tax=Bremia lactucae TaxID=4779 RepID=A0A976FPU2_BRELC|nr:hypothetical protein CCR75_006306 [Bremia lactucae]
MVLFNLPSPVHLGIFMIRFTAFVGIAALASASLTSGELAKSKELPWDGRFNDIKVKDIGTKYLTHILDMRNNSADAGAKNYVKINQKGRTLAYNEDKGVAYIKVDNSSVFKAQHNFRRSELVQFVKTNPKGKTFFRASFIKQEPFLNEHVWQIFFAESQMFQVRVDAKAKPPTLIFLCNGEWDPKWQAEFKYNTWYNFGVAISKDPKGDGAVVEFYTSMGDKDLKLEKTFTVVTKFALFEELHIGLLTLSDSEKVAPVMNENGDFIGFNGVTVKDHVSTSAAGVTVGF